MDNKVGIIGFGNMGSALAGQLKGKFEVHIFDKDKRKTDNLKGIKRAKSPADLAKEVEMIILAVKPQDFDPLLSEIKDNVSGKLVISIAAGIPTAYLEKVLKHCRIVRAMPNLPAKIGWGMIGLCAGASAEENDLVCASELFGFSGKVLSLEESKMDALTAVSGSGPGYFYYLCQGKNIAEIKRYNEESFIPLLTVAAQGVGFSSDESMILAEQTGRGSFAFLESSKATCLELMQQVASKGGTTEAGLAVLSNKGSLGDAVKAAFKRAGELARRG